MHAAYFTVLARGLAGELDILSLPEVLDHLDNHQVHFLLDRAVTGCYASRLGRDPGLAADPAALAALIRLLDLRARLQPFDIGALRALGRLAGRPDRTARAEFLERLDAEPQGLRDLLALHDMDLSPEEARRETESVLRALLRAYPAYIQVADLLLDLDFRDGREPGDWTASFRCPEPLEGVWRRHLFAHHARLGLDRAASRLWESLPAEDRDEILENLAAELFLRQGDRAGAKALYRSSLSRDPSQTPVRLRLGELENPTPVRPELLDERRVVVCLYSFNKAAMLARTLEGLAGTDLGRARVRVLLNGCSDDSRERVEAVLPRFGGRDATILDLPVNVGAPQARNWLAALPECREADFVAYLDDDVDVPRDWLARLLTVLEEAPDAGVAGCKVVHTGHPARLQYLYRAVSPVIRPDLFKLVMSTPEGQPDPGVYDFTRSTMNVMGCCHVLRGDVLREHPFDIRFSPSQIDDIDHDLQVCLAGRRVLYTGLVTCVHHQNSGFSGTAGKSLSRTQAGNIIGNDLKLCAKHLEHQERLRELSRADRERARSGADWRGERA